jgi:hypothetical protein
MHDWVELLNSISTGVVAAFTIVLVCVVYSQNRAAKLTERAWVVADFESPPPYSPEKIIRFAWKLTNLGKTPAWITEMSSPMGKVVPARGELPKEPPYEMKHPFPKEGLVLTPKGSIEQFLWLTSEQQAKLEVGEITLYIFGILKYKDIFGGRHETRYCFRFNPALGGADPATRDFCLAEQPNYNRAT